MSGKDLKQRGFATVFSIPYLLLGVTLSVLVTPRLTLADGDAWWAVQRGESLSTIGRRFEVSVDDLKHWNDLEDDRIFAGQKLRVQKRDRARRNPNFFKRYRINRGDVLSQVAKNHRVSIDEVLRWNPGLDPDRLVAGKYLVIRRKHALSRSASVGVPHAGELRHGVRLPAHPMYLLRDRARAWGTVETVQWIRRGFDVVKRRFGLAVRVRVHDLSLRKGGRMRGHSSHQSGRDMDMSFFQTRCGKRACPMISVRPSDIDMARQWALFHHWLKRDVVEAIFFDYSLHKAFYRYAKAQGASRAELSEWFQYPRGRDSPVGTIRHFGKHRDHVHVRFRCPSTDNECVSLFGPHRTRFDSDSRLASR